MVYLKDLTSGNMIFLVIGMILLQVLLVVFVSLYKDRPGIRYEMVSAMCVLQLIIIQALIVFLAIFPITPAVIVYYPLVYVITPTLFILDIWISYFICGVSSFCLIILSVYFSRESIRVYNVSAGNRGICTDPVSFLLRARLPPPSIMRFRTSSVNEFHR